MAATFSLLPPRPWSVRISAYAPSGIHRHGLSNRPITAPPPMFYAVNVVMLVNR